MDSASIDIVKQRQDPLRARYRSVAADARITDCARTGAEGDAEPFHGNRGARRGTRNAVALWHPSRRRWLQRPAECGRYAMCRPRELPGRYTAHRCGSARGSTPVEVVVDADVDVRGTLLVDRSVPIGFQGMRCRVHLQPADDADPAKVQMLLAAAEHSCVVMQTLRQGVPVETRWRAAQARGGAISGAGARSNLTPTTRFGQQAVLWPLPESMRA
jgi:hypothetical protein